ncbi:MAG: hypothetical protein NVSMB55_02980 [Mycobacteriales bacterium]
MAKSGRACSNRASRSSGHERSSSARLRGELSTVVEPGRDIRPRLVAGVSVRAAGTAPAMSGDDRDMVTDEGIDEGSRESVVEESTHDTAPEVLGMPAAGEPANGEQQAAPEPISTGQDEPAGPGQRQQVGEG